MPGDRRFNDGPTAAARDRDVDGGRDLVGQIVALRAETKQIVAFGARWAIS